MNDEKNNQSKKDVSRECIFTTIASEAAGLYNLLITVSTGVFGGTLLFLDRIAPSPTKQSLWFLGLGWIMLLLCTVACVWIRWKNLESGRMALEGDFEAACKIDKPNRLLTQLAILSLIVGVTFVGIFGFVNIVHKVNINERSNRMVEKKDEQKQIDEEKIKIEKRAIPYGSINQPQKKQEIENDADANGDDSQETTDDSAEDSES